MSPAALQLIDSPPALAPIQLPAHLDRVLKELQRISGKQQAEEVFTANGIITQVQEGRWVQGHDQINDFVKHIPSSIRYIPKAYSATGETGYIAGNIAFGSGGEEQYNFMLGIVKDPDGSWKIDSQMLSEIEPPEYDRPIVADTIIEKLDDAGIQRGVILSVAYWFGSPARKLPLEDERRKTREENDFTISEAAKYPDRLTPFCSVNPLGSYALDEVSRCAAIPAVKGMKLHFNNSRIDLENEGHVEKVKAFFRACDENDLAVVIHISRAHEIFIDRILPEAKSIPVQIAHMASGWENAALFAEAMHAGKPGTENLYFDWTQALPLNNGSRSREMVDDAVHVMRSIGMDRILFGSDMPLPSNASPREWWRKSILPLPLKDEEIRDIADNMPPYLQ